MANNYAINDVKYAWEQEATIGTSPLSAADLVLTTEREIDFALGINQRNIRKARGLSYQKTGDGQDFRKTNQTTTITIPFEGSADMLVKPLATLFQNVTISGTNPYKYQYDPYTGQAQHTIAKADVTGYALSLYKWWLTNGSESETLDGAIVRQLTIGSKEDEPLLISAEFAGMTYAALQDTSGVVVTDLAKKVLLHSDLTFTVAGSSVDVVSWQVRINNNAASRHFQNQEPQRHNLGALDVSIDLVISTNGSDYKAGVKADTDYLFEVYKGSKTGATAEDFYLQCNFVPQDTPYSEESNERVVTYTGTGANDGTNPAIQVIVATSSSRLTSM